MKKVLLSLVIAIMFLIPLESKSNDFKLSTKDWFDVCTRVDMDWVNFCNGYIQGVIDSLSSTEFCPNSSATRASLVTSVDNYLTRNPEYKVGEAFSKIRNILKLSYPCK